MFCGVLFLAASLPLSPALISASEPEDQHLLPSDVLEAWTKPGLFDFASVEGESQETRTYKGEVSRARNVFFAARNDQGACVLFEREQDGKDFNSSVFGRNDLPERNPPRYNTLLLSDSEVLSRQVLTEFDRFRSVDDGRNPPRTISPKP